MNESGAEALDGQIAVVTGGGRGIGRAAALALGAAGASVGVLGRTSDELDEVVQALASAGVPALALQADVTDAAQVERAFTSVAEQLGPVDVLVNNAGRNTVVGPLWDVDLEEWWRDVAVNLLGTACCSKAVLGSMVARKHGRIINVVSGAGAYAFPYDTGYATSKAGAIRLTDSVAAETAEHGVQVFAFNPGRVDTKLGRDLRASSWNQRWLGPMWSNLAEPIPPEVPAAAIVYLASGAADGLSGCLLDVHDDLPALAADAASLTGTASYRMVLNRPG